MAATSATEASECVDPIRAQKFADVYIAIMGA
jgi:hypothetical protein